MEALTTNHRADTPSAAHVRPLRIEMVVPTLTAAGMEQVVAHLIRWLHARGHDVGVTCIESVGTIGERLRDEGYRVTLVPTPGLHTQWWPSPLAAWLERLAPDVIHPHSGVWLKSARAARRIPRRSLIATIHGIEVQEPWWANAYTRLAMRYTDHVVAVSENVRAYLTQHYGVPQRQIDVIVNGIDTTIYRPGPRARFRAERGIGADTFVIGHVARLAPIKNQAMLIRALAILRQHVPCCALVIVGDGPLRAELAELASVVGVAGSVHFLGERQDVPELYREFDAFALTSWIEGTSMSILEAMASALPVVATAVGGTPSLVGDRGLLVKADDHVELASALARLAREAALRDHLGRAAREWVLANATVAAMAERYEALYRVCFRRANASRESAR